MGDHFHSSLRELRQQLDLMNSRTASILNKSRQHTNMLTHDSSTVGQSPSVTTDNMQQIKHIGATVGTLAKQQEDRFQKLEHQLDLLSDQLDHLSTANPQYTPPESPGLSDSASHHSDTASISSHYSHMPRILHSDMTPATVADIGGYFYPHFGQHRDDDQQYISDAYTFVGRVNRVRQTKSIANIEVFLRGSALRWFHIGLRSDGIHVFDMYNGKFDIGAFCDTLILLFGVPKSLTTVSHLGSLHLIASCMRSEIIEDYVFPALEYLRPQEYHFYSDSGASIAVTRSLTLYKQSFEPCTVSPETFDCTAPPEVLDFYDLLHILGRLRRSEFEQKLDKALSRNREHTADIAPLKGKRGNQAGTSVKQEPTFASVDSNMKPSTTTSAKSHDYHLENIDTTRPRVQSTSPTVQVPGNVDNEVAESVASTTEPYPPAPTAESCPATPIASCQPSSSDMNPEPQVNKVCEGMRMFFATQEVQAMQDETSYCFTDFHCGAEDVGLQHMKPQQQQNAAREEVAIPVSHSSQDPVCQQSSVLAAHQGSDSSPNDNVSQGKVDSPSTITGLARWAQRAAKIRAENETDPSQDNMPSFGKFDLKNSRLSLPAPATEVPFVQESANIEATVGDDSLTERPDSPSEVEDEIKSWSTENEDSNLEIDWQEIPQGPDYALHDLTFLFTGQLEYILRGEVQGLIKRHRGKITHKPSRKVDYVVLGAKPGRNKLAIVKELNLEIIDERGLFDLILRRMDGIETESEQKKRTEMMIKRFNKEIKDTWTAINTPYQYNWTSTSGDQPKERTLDQQQQREQQIRSVPSQFALGPQAKAFLINFNIFPPTDICLETPEYDDYENSIMNALIKEAFEYERCIVRFRWYHGNAPPLVTSLGGERLHTLSDLETAKNKIDAIRRENEKNRLAWNAKSSSLQPQSA